LHYPAIPDSARIVKFVDVGMGFGGLTVALAELFPEKLVLGMEIRAKVSIFISHTWYVYKRLKHLT
jgi:tRNA (guanine-N7-)-methyltransferase